MSVCSFPLCNDSRLCCLKCMISKHTDHSNYQILLDELEDSNIEELSVPTNWTNILGNLKDDLGEIIRICKKNSHSANNFEKSAEEETQKIDSLFDTLLEEIQEKVNGIRKHVKKLTIENQKNTVQKLKDLIDTLQKILSPSDLLSHINQYIKNQYSDDFDKQLQEDYDFEQMLNKFFTTSRISEEEHEEIYRKFNFLTKNRKSEDIVPKIMMNSQTINEIREQALNVLDDKTKFSQIFFQENQLYDYQNLDKIRVFTCGYDEITTTTGKILNVLQIDSFSFLLVRDLNQYEVWDIKGHFCKTKFFIKNCQSPDVVIPLKLPTGLAILYLSKQNFVTLKDQKSNQTLKYFPFPPGQVIKDIKLLSEKNEDYQIQGPIIIAILFITGETKILNLTRGNIIELRNKQTVLIESLCEQRHYYVPSQGIVQTNLLLSCTQDMLSVWYPLNGKSVRNLKLGIKQNEQLKQVKGFNITKKEIEQSYFADYVVNCPSKSAIAVLTNKFLRVYNWFKAQCLKEIQIDECDRFEILPSFLKNELKNIFLLYNISENKPAEYVTCDWSNSPPEYWNSGSLTNYTMVRALNNYKVLEMGKLKCQDPNNKNISSNSQGQQISARIKSLT
ncbi:hypothetical protein PPERSA_04773 [Pseudocohnilembus persalinus]|uniref:Uncharacterized protein n=1 Tax=Pseudocohnilembus persalinus TaxID=266149 RepID=A0A0V0QP06_PSEPJ|nr:hypothetical protein PPERSA_04773 [Pseudocohnilembus persalinus]|eukprot:KRX03895.1 hypothetical protein PPERSA_04773 [Pseudocohnilembus persalinus]